MSEDIQEIIEEKVDEVLGDTDVEDTEFSSRQEIVEAVAERVREERQTSEASDTEMSRRGFLKTGALGLGGLALASSGAANFQLLGTGGGSEQVLSDVLSNGNDISGNDIVDGGTTVWDSNNSQIPSGVVQSTGLDADTVQGKRPQEIFQIGRTDSAETFAEKDVSLETISGGWGISNNSINLNASGTTSTASFGGDYAGQADNANRSASCFGITMSPNQDLDAIKATQNKDAEGNPTKVYNIYAVDLSDSSIVDSVENPKQTQKLVGPFRSDRDYAIVVYNGGSSMYIAYEYSDSGVSFSSNLVDVINGQRGSSPTSTSTATYEAYAINKVQGIVYDKKTSASIGIEWPRSNDVNGWDRATFRSSSNDGSVDVYVEASSDGGSTWTEVAGPIDRGDNIPASASDNVRLRVELSRPSASDASPELHSVYRRYLV